MSIVYMQFSNCIPVKGFGRTAFYDVQRNRYIFSTNNFSNILSSKKNKIPIDKIDDDFKAHLDTLVSDGWGIYINKLAADLFPKLDLSWHSFSTITNAQIDLNNNEADMANFIEVVIPQFEKLICKYYQINFLQPISFKKISSFLRSFDDTGVSALNLVLPYLYISTEELTTLFETQPRLQSLFFYSCPITEHNIPRKNKIFYSQNDINIRFENNILTDYFTTNIFFFSESQNHNCYYNRKLCIDVDGNIKNSPEHERTFGNVKNTALADSVKTPGFQDLWFIHKEIIDVCKVCEFRHMCVDACVPLQRKDGTWFRSKECNYNPYICKWKGEEGYKTLAESGVICNRKGLNIDEKELTNINVKIWGE